MNMNKNSNPLDHLIKCCEDSLESGSLEIKKFDILNAKDELRKLRQKLTDFNQELFNCNQDLVEETNKILDYKVAGWSRINSRGDLYDIRSIYNPYIDNNTLITVYYNEKEYKEKYDKLSK